MKIKADQERENPLYRSESRSPEVRSKGGLSVDTSMRKGKTTNVHDKK
jgi:hypothetical protein